MKVGSLFAGVGGFDRGLELAGHSIAWQVEINDFSNRVLERRWPGVSKYEDVQAVAWALGEARRQGYCFCNQEVRTGDESCPDCAVVRYLTPELVGIIRQTWSATQIAEAIWNGQSLLSRREEGHRPSAQQNRESRSTEQDRTSRHLRAMWREAASVQGWPDSYSGAPSRLLEAVRGAVAVSGLPPLGAQVALERIMAKPFAVKVDLICGGFP